MPTIDDAQKLRSRHLAVCSKAEQDVALVLSRQQQMDGDMKDLRALIDSLRGDLKSARSAQVQKCCLVVSN